MTKLDAVTRKAEAKLTHDVGALEISEHPSFTSLVSDDGGVYERVNLLGSIEWAWPRWPADDPRWHTATALMQTIADSDLREGVNEADVAWAKAMQEAVDAIDDVRSREDSEIERLHRVIGAGESMIDLANRALRLHAEIRERQMQRGFGDLLIADDGWTLETSNSTRALDGGRS